MRLILVLMDISRYDVLLSVAVTKKAIGALKEHLLHLLWVYADVYILLAVLILRQSDHP